MIDWARVSDLKKEVGEEDFEEIAELFMEEVEEVVARLEAGASENWEADFHFLKSSSLNMGFAELARLCQEAETRARTGLGGAEYAPAVASSFRASKAAFEQGLAA